MGRIHAEKALLPACAIHFRTALGRKIRTLNYITLFDICQHKFLVTQERSPAEHAPSPYFCGVTQITHTGVFRGCAVVPYRISRGVSGHADLITLFSMRAFHQIHANFSSELASPCLRRRLMTLPPLTSAPAPLSTAALSTAALPTDDAPYPTHVMHRPTSTSCATLDHDALDCGASTEFLRLLRRIFRTFVPLFSIYCLFCALFLNIRSLFSIIYA